MSKPKPTSTYQTLIADVSTWDEHLAEAHRASEAEAIACRAAEKRAAAAGRALGLPEVELLVSHTFRTRSSRPRVVHCTNTWREVPLK